MAQLAKDILNSYVDSQFPKLEVINVSALETMFEAYTPYEIVAGSEMSAEELVDTFRLSLITESLTEQYGKTYRIGANLYNADWLSNYVSGFWEPDERGHADPFKNILVDFGVDEKKLDVEIQVARESVDYSTKHESGFHPIALTTYGMIQECVTDYWYELQRGFFPPTSNTAKILSMVKGREALHTVQFRNLTSLQLESDPALLPEIINAATNFKMPSNHIPLVSELESKTKEWIPRMNGEVSELLRRIIMNLHSVLNDKDRLGKLLMEYASADDRKLIEKLPNSIVKQAMGSINGLHGLVGEIVLEQLGLVAEETNTDQSLSEKVIYRFKGIIKRWAVERMQMEGFINIYSGQNQRRKDRLTP